MSTPDHNSIPPGWVGGFAQSKKEFEYPNPDLSSLPLLKNMDNIKLLTRQQKATWPEFSWVNENNARCFQMFSPDISRVGYNDEGRVYSIICPQQGLYVPNLGALNVEVTVTGQRGWVDETNYTMAADMTVEANIWFSPSTYDKPIYQRLLELFNLLQIPFPLDKQNALKINLLNAENPNEHILPIRDGESSFFKSPGFSDHEDAWSVAFVDVMIGSNVPATGPIPANNKLVDEFNQKLMVVFNLASGNLLGEGGILSWNVWVGSPRLVDREEWKTHAERWRKSIDEGHGGPSGLGTTPRLENGDPYNPDEELLEQALEDLWNWVKTNFPV